MPDTPPIPVSQEEWEAQWAFYRHTVAQRDQAWDEVRELRQLLQRLGHLMHFPTPTDEDLVDDLANVLMHMVVGWHERLGVDLAEHPEVERVMARYRATKTR